MAEVSRREVQRLITKWRRILGIGNQWRVDLKINKAPRGEELEDAQAHIVVSPGYYHADMVVNAWQCVGIDLDEVVCHEMLHIVMKGVETVVEGAMGDRFAEVGEQMLESVVERLSRVLVRLDRQAMRKRES